MRAAYAAKSRLPLCPDGAKFPSFPARHSAPSKGKKSITSDALFADLRLSPPSLVMLFLPIRNAEHEPERKGTLPRMGQRGRENRDLAEQRSARTRLSLR